MATETQHKALAEWTAFLGLLRRLLEEAQEDYNTAQAQIEKLEHQITQVSLSLEAAQEATPDA